MLRAFSFVIFFALSAVPCAQAHKVTTVSVVCDIFTETGTFEVNLAMDVEPSGDPAIDDLISPEQAARDFAQNALVIFFDDQEMTDLKLESKILETSDEETPEELKRVKASAVLSAKIPEGAENFLLFVNEDTEASVVMVFRKDGKPERRMQVLFPGDFSRPYSVFPVGENPKPGQAEKAVPKIDTDQGATESEAGEVPEKSGFLTFVRAGMAVIFPDGTRHWAFAIVMVLLSLRMRPIISQMGTFIVAHCAGLAVAALGIMTFSDPMAKAVVGLAIVALAVDNFISEKPAWWRFGVIGFAGLFHGFLFSETAPADLLGLVGFNIGIEIALIAVLMVALVLLNLLSRQENFKKAVLLPANAVLLIGGFYWAFLG